MSSGVVRSTALRAGGACVRCRKGKTKCVYENGRAPCKNCAKGMHDCYLPSESMAHHHGQSPARHANPHRPPRDSLPAAGPGVVAEARQPVVGSSAARHVQTGSDNPLAGSRIPALFPIPHYHTRARASLVALPDGATHFIAVGLREPPRILIRVFCETPELLTPELIAECERVVSKTFPACVAFHKPSFVQQLKSASLDAALVYGLLTCAARSSPSLIRRYGGPTQAAETFAAKAMTLINQNLDHPNLVDIQALCLIIIHEWGSRNAVRAYIYLGQAARMVQMYRILNSHHASPDGDMFLRDESLRRTVWLIYILDCLLTSTPGRFAALSPLDTADVPLPCSDINFAFGNAVFVKTLRQQLDPTAVPPGQPPSEIGEFGYIVLASTIWRDVVGMLTTTTLASFREEDCGDLIAKIEGLRASLPMQFVDKPGQINLHMTMGSGYTFAMLHCLLHCATIFVHRRRLLQEVTSVNFNLESFRLNARCHDIIDRLFTSCHGTISLLTAVEAGSEKDHTPCFPIFMLFSAFTASATVAYLSLKGLTPPNAVETAAHIVKDGLRFMSDGTENWPLMGSWLRHLTVMQRVLNNDAAAANGGSLRHGSTSHGAGVKDEISSNADTNPDAMDYDQQTNHAGSVSGQGNPRSVSESVRGDSEPPVVLARRPGVTTINGSGGASTPTTVSPPPSNTTHGAVPDIKQQPSPEMANGIVPPQDGQTTSQDMTAPELCQAFERQLLDLDDLAAFMGGGV
ncbi:general repressor of transcription [Fusarium acutatum]|uniref:General repressor of transcription n=1 Tax=Fusarium acutatum TaxID=78861 RepID=A0A8H4JWL9_9HYPO|nr:general repressor of transcription [Fusarium acutatum]